MTKSLLLLLLFPLLAFSQGSTNDYLLSQKPASGPLVVRPVTPAVGKLLGWPASINTPASITLGTSLSITGTTLNAIPAVGSITGLGTGIATALAINSGTAGAPVLLNAALGTPSSGVVTNLTGTASININGTVGATTPNTGAFSSVSINGATPSANSNFATTSINTNYLEVKTTSTGTQAAAGIFMENSTSNGYLFKAGTGYTTYKTIAANDLGFYNNNIGGNISILNDYTSGNINLAAGGSSTAHLTIKASGVINVSGIPTSSAGLVTGDLWSDGGTIKVIP